MKFLGLLTRCRDEFYIREFCDYYIKQSVDHIHIIDDDSNDKSIYDALDKNHVTVHHVKRMYDDVSTYEQSHIHSNDTPNKIYRDIRSSYEWLIYVDVDEFVATRHNMNHTLREELQHIITVNPCVDQIVVPWVLMSGRYFKQSPSSVLQEIVHRHDYDNKHPYHVQKFRCRYDSVEVKSIFKCDRFDYIHDHVPGTHTHQHRNIINGVNLSDHHDGMLYHNLREQNISDAFLLCYHYRYISEQHARDKLKTNGWYINDGYTLGDLMNTSYPEVIDTTMKDK